MPNPTALIVFLVLLSHAGSDGECWPRRTTIASEANVAARHVSTALRDLESIGAVKTIRKKGERSRYLVSFTPPHKVVTESVISAIHTDDKICQGVVTESVSSQVTDSVTTRNRPVNIPMNIPNDVARARAQEESDKANDLADAYAAQPKETPMQTVRRRMLEHARRRTIEMRDEDMSEQGNATEA